MIGIAAENETVDRTARVLRVWAATGPKETGEGLTVKQEIKAIDDRDDSNDREFLAQYGGFGSGMKRSAELQSLPEAKLTEGVSIDDYSTWRATRFAAWRKPDESSPKAGTERGN